MQEHSNNLTSDQESNKVSEGTQERINQDLKQIYNRMAFDVIHQAYNYYILGESVWSDSVWDRRAKEVYLNRETLDPQLKEIFDQLSENHLSMFFLKLKDYERILTSDDNTEKDVLNVS